MKSLESLIGRSNSPPNENTQITNYTIKTLNKMKTIKTLFFATLLFTMTTNAQITKGNWMVGGDASFSSSSYKTKNQNGLDVTSTTNDIIINPNIGYFFMDKLVAGTSLGINSHKFSSSSTGGTVKDYSFGPFVRYYFMKPDKRVNILAQVSYFYGINNNTAGESKSTGYNFKTGPVVFLNSSVGIEFLLEYNSLKYPGFGYNAFETKNTFQVGLGLQIHLKK